VATIRRRGMGYFAQDGILEVGEKATMNCPDFVRATALIALFPNFLHSTFLHDVVPVPFVLKLKFVFFASLAI